MGKKGKAIYLDEDILQQVKKMRKEYKFNFSEWINSNFREKFMSIESKEFEIRGYLRKVEKLKQEIKEVEERNHTYAEMLTTIERRFFKQIPIWIDKGCDMKSLCIRFNVTFNRNIDFEDFKKVYGVINRKK